ncbi:MAG: FAD-dependent oxidoreductase [Deltaproteobacteria bacterium]|nr:FAD-dependent oxidoreductase [Deltaproteobacteria bacterium]
MNNDKKIGVYVCHCGTNISHTVAVDEVVAHAKTLPDVEVAREYKYMCSEPGQELIKKDISEQGLNRVVVASCSPLMHEGTFRKTCESAGLNRFLFQMANIREHCSWVHNDKADATKKAKHLVGAAVGRVGFHKPMELREAPVRPETLVVGAGIAGIEAALRIADSGKTVYLVEKEPSIGGHMAQFDKTFPTLDCAACILTPKMGMVAQHPNIKLFSYSEVEAVSGYVGNFKVKVRRKARYVNEKKCTGCGECTSVCPVQTRSQFEENLSFRKAIYRSFPQAVPNTFLIDKKGRAPCRAACPAGVHTQGYIALIADKKYTEAAELLRKDMPLPSVCGRVCYHPCEDKCERANLDDSIAICALKRFVADWALNQKIEVKPLPVIKKEKVAVVGSGPAGLACANELIRRGYCVDVFEAAEKAGGMLRYGIPAYRLPEEVLDKELAYLQNIGIGIHTNQKVASVESLKSKGYSAVFLSLGAQGGMQLKISGDTSRGVIDALEFLRSVKSGSLKQCKGTVVIIGGGNSAMDAARTALRLGAKEVKVIYRRSRAEMPAHDLEIEEAVKEGVTFEYLAAPTKIVSKDGQVRSLICQRMKLGEPDASGRRKPIAIEGTEFETPAEMMVTAIGQVPLLEKMAPSLKMTPSGWIETDPITLETTEQGVFAGGDVVTGPSTVVDAFAAGKRAAESIDRYLAGSDMRLGRDQLPSVAGAPDISKTPLAKRAEPARLDDATSKASFAEVISTLTEAQAITEAKRCLACGVCSECLECLMKCEAAAIDHNQLDEIVEVNVGTVVIATGFESFNARKMARYGYGKLKNVLTALEFERLSHASGPTGGEILTVDGKTPQSVAIIHCVGSRDENHQLSCSRVCCMYSLKFAHLVKEKTGAEVYNLYIDMRTPGKGYEEFYRRLLSEDVHFIRGKCSEITDLAETPKEKGKLFVHCEDTLLGVKRRIPVDMVILATALKASSTAPEIAKQFSLSCVQDGFFLEKHPKLAPVEVATDGIYLAGACQGPKDIPDSVAQGAAAAACALSLMDRGKVIIEPITSHIDAKLCSGCQVCVQSCPYEAIVYRAEENRSEVIEELCKGCGTCVAGCPSGAANQNHFERNQIYAELEGVLKRHTAKIGVKQSSGFGSDQKGKQTQPTYQDQAL